jgi:hypothetical protein
MKSRFLQITFRSFVAALFTFFPGNRIPILALILVLGFNRNGLDTNLLSRNLFSHAKASPRFESSQTGSEIEQWEYITQSGDTLEIIAARFKVALKDVEIQPGVPVDQLLDPGRIVRVNRPRLDESSVSWLLPDPEVVYSPSTAGFNTQDFVASAGGYLSEHQEYMRSTGLTSAAEIIERVAVENSFHPRLLLAILEYQCGCVTGGFDAGQDANYLMGVDDPLRRGLYRQLGWVVNQLSLGYYGWRQGILHNLVLEDGSVIPIPPDLNAGSVSVAYLFSRLTNTLDWHQAMDPDRGLIRLHKELFSEIQDMSMDTSEVFTPGLSQPDMILPLQLDYEWSYTSGPHQAWETEGALAALDFAPASDRFGCEPSPAWVLAVADGLVVRSEHNALVLDLDQDGLEGTGWAVLYMHLADFQRAAAGTMVRRGDLLGHPSCEGGPADGTHLHIARKFNGEWIAAGGPIPFMMSGWSARAGSLPYEGSLIRGDRVVLANTLSPAAAFISRTGEDMLFDARISHNLWWEDE